MDGVREQDKFLPIANISRIMKEALPQNAKISKDAKELVQQCVSDFIIFITSECVSSIDIQLYLQGAYRDRRYGRSDAPQYPLQNKSSADNPGLVTSVKEKSGKQ